MPMTHDGLRGLVHRWRARRAKLPWTELEAEAVRQGCSAADIFFDRAGAAEPSVAGAEAVHAESVQPEERSAHPMRWRGLDPLPASRPG